MPNPFPGVDPYVEAAGLWPGFGNLLVGDCSRLLNRVLKPRGYAAFVEERLDLVDLPDGPEDRRPDVMVAGGAGRPPARSGQDGATAVLDLEPTLVSVPMYETVTSASIEIHYPPDHRLVTAIELLSPSNKGTHRAAYMAKRRAVLASDVSLVEVDLLLGGRRPDTIGPLPAGDLCALVSRGDRRPECQAFTWSIRRALPSIPIPLRPGDADVTLALAEAYARTYDDGPYDLASLYNRPAPGPLSDVDRAWAAELVGRP